MELRYPFVIVIGIICIIALFFLNKKNRDKYKEGIKVANTKYLLENSEYKAVIKKYKFFYYVAFAICIFALLFSFILVSRPAKVETTDSTMYNRDIFLCMDVSRSVNELNEQLVDNLKEVVKNMKGERFGISIFNTSSVLLVPLTDDYEYILDVLDTLKDSLNITNNNNYTNSKYLYLYNYIMAGTIVGNNDRGSSLISDGLASCVYDFPDLNEDRKRIIIFSTDNESLGTPLLTLKEAANLCKEKNIVVYAVTPNEIKSNDKIELEEAVNITNGSLYTSSKKENTLNIINSIEKQEKSLIKGKKERKTTDVPQIPFIILIILIFVFSILNIKVNI